MRAPGREILATDAGVSGLKGTAVRRPWRLKRINPTYVMRSVRPQHLTAPALADPMKKA
jgi:hypothetical protein